jgi:NADH:ubiquinone oxidoreductase subunit K
MFIAKNFFDVSAFLLVAGILGIFVVRKNVILMLLSLELMLLGASFNFGLLTLVLDDAIGEVFALLIIIVAGSESALGLAIFVALYRLANSIDANRLNVLKG